MQATKLAIPDVILLEPKIYADERGLFFESYNQKIFEELTGLKKTFVQDNQSKSAKGVLRGLHFQKAPKAQGKLVRVLRGEVFDVAVDARKNSSTFGKWVGEILSAENKKQLWIPEGFAHGFLTLVDDTEVLYKTTDYYSPAHEVGIIWNDPTIAIPWSFTINQSEFIISKKDLLYSPLSQV